MSGRGAAASRKLGAGWAGDEPAGGPFAPLVLGEVVGDKRNLKTLVSGVRLQMFSRRARLTIVVTQCPPSPFFFLTSA